MNKVGRNDPCPCGSGRKYKQCCLRIDTSGSLESTPVRSPELGGVAARYNRAVSSQLEGNLDEAIRGYRDVLARVPEHVDARYNLALALGAQGRLDEAVTSYRGVLARRPDFAEARSNLGLLLQTQGQLDEAIDCYRAALAIKPHPLIYSNLGNAQDELGQIDAAVSSYRRAFELGDALEIRVNFARCAKRLDARHADPGLRGLVARAMDEAWTRPSDLSRAAIRLIRADPNIDAGIDRASRAWPELLSERELLGPAGLSALANDGLLLSLLQNAPISDMAMERFLTMVRGAMLDAALACREGDDDDPTVTALHCAIARQCFLNEYVFACSEAETARMEALRSQIADALTSGGIVPTLWLTAAAAYAPLAGLAGSDRLLARSWPNAVRTLLTEQIVEPATERRHRERIERMTAIDDPVSLQVKRQYEENPYPRWTRVPVATKARRLNAYLRQQFPFAEFAPLANDHPIEVLIAGCGTGQEAIDTAHIVGSHVVAVDLSATSLAYAMRKTAEANVDNVEYAQADILKLVETGRTFDLITSVGVLHHLADPMRGWRTLLTLLRPGGLMRIGLYSERARRDVVSARAFIAERGYTSTTDDIRRARQALAGSASGRLADVALFRDFYTTSECRDLLFHVQEHRFTLPEIEAMLAELGLRFIGFTLEPQVVHAYRTRFPYDRTLTDLSAWHAFEFQYPETFIGMYRFWAQKPR